MSDANPREDSFKDDDSKRQEAVAGNDPRDEDVEEGELPSDAEIAIGDSQHTQPAQPAQRTMGRGHGMPSSSPAHVLPNPSHHLLARPSRPILSDLSGPSGLPGRPSRGHGAPARGTFSPRGGPVPRAGQPNTPTKTPKLDGKKRSPRAPKGTPAKLQNMRVCTQ